MESKYQSYKDFINNGGEKYWQKIWADQKIFAVQEDASKKKFYGLIEFPYPSGDGLHTGHLRSNTAMDIICRQRRMQGYNVLYPIGFDSFGLPAENYAVKKKVKPQVTTTNNIKVFTKQLKEAGFSFDWSRAFSTTDQDYYRWTQWIFLQMFKKGLAEKKKETINWCTSCKIGLANEEVVNGVCERCGGEVIKKEKEQWVLKITKYADRLIDDLGSVDYLERIKTQQINWIGRSAGAEVIFKITTPNPLLQKEGIAKEDFLEKEGVSSTFEGEVAEPREARGVNLTVFTTRPDTLFGVTFMVVAPEHEMISNFKFQISNFQEVEAYISQAKKKSDLERTDLNKEKTGVELKGVQAINPVNGQAIPIFVADYVMMGYGTGAIMAVPGHDERDWAFAKKYDIPIVQVVAPLFTTTTGPDAVRPDKKIERRQTAYVFVKHWTEDKFLCLDWKRFNWHSAIIGGVEDGEDMVAAAIREVREETGYQNLKFIKHLGEFHNIFFASHKDVNRYAYGFGMYFELVDGEHEEPASEHTEHHEAVWVARQQVEDYLNLEGNKYIWRVLNNNEACFTGDGIAVNSGEFSGLPTNEFKEKIISWLEEKGLGKKQVQYKLRDWIFSRQRYWGEPIPLVFCENCAVKIKNQKSKIKNHEELNQGEVLNPGWHAVPEDKLPVTLPDIDDFMPTEDGDSPLAKVEEWVKTECPVCGGEARRETDVMPNWAGSNWYFIRYSDPKNNQQLVAPGKAKYWLPVDWYNGGMEHTTLHLLYSRFVWKFLSDIGAVPKECGVEPYAKRTAHGMILGEGGVKMSKSKGNVINPDDYVKKYGADTLRVYEMFMGPFDQPIAWEDKSVNGVYRFLNRVWNLQEKVTENTKTQKHKNTNINRLVHQTIKKVGEDIEAMKFNTAISQLMILVNEFERQPQLRITDYGLLITILSPFAPHICEELWQRLGHNNSLVFEKWPDYDPALIQEAEFELVVQINGKVRDKITAAVALSEEEIKQKVLKSEKVQKWLAGKEPKKVIYIKGRLINVVI